LASGEHEGDLKMAIYQCGGMRYADLTRKVKLAANFCTNLAKIESLTNRLYKSRFDALPNTSVKPCRDTRLSLSRATYRTEMRRS
jgi:hypothetical protein